jgi:condensin complex subunit 1
MAVVEVIGSLFRELATSPDITSDSAQTERQLNGLYDLLLERTLDVSSYVRTKVLSVLAKLCDLPVKFPKQRLAVTRAAIGALEDKATGVRKSAVVLLVKLVVTHPYGLMHGGLLGLEEWEERYRTVKDELEKVEEGMGKAIEGQDDKEEEEEYETDTDTEEDETEKGGNGDEGEIQEEDEEMEEFSVARTPMGLKTPKKTPRKTPRRMLKYFPFLLI